MSPHLHEDDTVVDAAPHVTDDLQRLYAVRFAFAVVWAGLLVISASTLNPLSVGLLLLYPVFDVAAAIADYRSPGLLPPRGALMLNIVLSTLTTIGLAVAATSGIPSVLRVWGAWAIAAGLVQLVVAVQRRRLGGQWPLILSGAISTLAGAGFVLTADGTDPPLTNLAGYAVLGGVFFLVSAIRLRRAARPARP
jgi:uncharacterized membrane protein HdeD (DUF308 family)